jgi:EAL domain-containing protein (putative c-di-GMP-specific phosphodiesterase class I)
VAATDAEGQHCSVAPKLSGAQVAKLTEPGSIRPYVQAIHALIDGEIVGHEILSRGPEGAYEQPGDFFRLSHETNVLTLVDLRCLRTCIEAATRIEDRGRVHVNLFPSTLVDTPWQRIVELMEQAAGAARYCIELSEQQFIGAPAYLIESVFALREAGVQVAIDDVGYGRSSLEALVLLEPDVIKLAREFVKGVDGGRPRRRGLERLTRATQTLSTSIVAEGVETEGERDVLLELGILLAQGFLWDEPIPVRMA